MVVVITTVLHKGFRVPFVALWRYVYTSHYLYYKNQLNDQSHCIRINLGIFAVVALLGASANCYSAISLYTGIESGVNISDNISLASKGNESSDVVVQLKPTVSLISKSKRSTVKLDYALQDLSYARNTDSNSIFHQLNATGDAEFIPETFSISTNISRTQYASSPAGRSSFGNFNIADRHNVTRANISPNLKLHYSNYAQGEVDYLAGHIALDNVASSSSIYKLDARFNSGSEFTRFRWETKLSQLKEQRIDSGLPDIYYQEASASAEYALFRHVYVKSEFGSFESDYQESLFSSSYGHYQSYGLRVQPSRRADFSAIGGPDYRSVNMALSPTPRTSFKGFWRDSKFGLGFGAKASAAFKLKLRHVEWLITYSDRLTSIQQIILTQSAPNANLQTFDLTDQLFRQKQTNWSVTRHGKMVESGISFFIDRRDYDVIQVDKPISVAGIKTNITWQLDGRLNAFATTHNEYRKAEKDVKAGRLESVSLGLELKKRRYTSASVSYRYTAQANPLQAGGGTSYVENSVLLLATYQR